MVAGQAVGGVRNGKEGGRCGRWADGTAAGRRRPWAEVEAGSGGGLGAHAGEEEDDSEKSYRRRRRRGFTDLDGEEAGEGRGREGEKWGASSS
jgi:hypothetical protein